MSVALYMDVHVPRAVTEALRLRRGDVLSAQQDNATTLDDSALLDRATALGRLMFSQDEDMLREAARRQRSGQNFAGLVYAHQLEVTIGQLIEDLEIIAKLAEEHEVANRVQYLPL